MAAITGFIGTQSDTLERQCEVAREEGLGAAVRCLPPLERSHAELTRTVWIRRSLEDLLKDRTVKVQEAKDGRLEFVLDEPLNLGRDLPWMPGVRDEFSRVSMIGEAAKMACPTWDLPAGSPVVGGACVGASAGQSVVPESVRKKFLPVIKEQGRLEEAVCESCYATGGNYASPHVQAGEIVRYWWSADLTRRDKPQWVETVVRAIRAEKFPVERMKDPRTGKPVLPFRIHSSGDFFDHAYASAWIDVCNEIPEIMFWAPSRTWAARGWPDFWRKELARLKHGNLALRPSGYYFNGPAPSPKDVPWPGAWVEGMAMGTCSIVKDEVQKNDQRFDWQCQTYAIQDDAHSCFNAKAPDGKIGCRACWLRPDLRVMYAAH